MKIPADQIETLTDALDHYVCADRAYAQGERWSRVETLLAGAFTDDVELGGAHALRGLLALERGRLTKALSDAEGALMLSPKEARGYYVRGRVRLERGAAGALDDLAKAAELGQRKEAAVLHWQATALFRAGRHDEALAVQREALKLKPHDQELVEQLGEFEKTANTGAQK